MEKYLINPNQRIATVNKNIYGHFSEQMGVSLLHEITPIYIF